MIEALISGGGGGGFEFGLVLGDTVELGLLLAGF
jgi:hypothetical protein